MKADLHMHTIYSDGRKTPEELIALAKEADVDIIAITDHDTVQDVEHIKKLADDAGIIYLPGVELSTIEANKSVHLLGYFTDESYNKDTLQNYFSYIKNARKKRAKKIIKNLKTYFDITITYEDVKELSNGIIARPHIAKAITEEYPKYTHDIIFDTMIGDTCKAYEPTSELDVEAGIKLLKDHHCQVVLAHPTLLKPHIKEKVLAYNYDGIEARYYRNQEGEEEQFRQLAKKRDMFITGGSDYHGIEGDTNHGSIGEVTINGKDLDIVLKKLQIDG